MKPALFKVWVGIEDDENEFTERYDGRTVRALTAEEAIKKIRKRKGQFISGVELLARED